MPVKLSLTLPRAGTSIPAELEAGQRIGIVGKIGAGKSTFIRALADLDSSLVTHSDGVTIADAARQRTARRTTVQALVSDMVKGEDTSRLDFAAEAMAALGLWEMRTAAVSRLPASSEAAMRILHALLSHGSLLLFDEEFDHLDPVSLENTFEFLAEKAADRIIVFASHSVSAASRATHLLALGSGQLLFWGSPEKLIQETRDDQFEIYASPNPGALNLAEPFVCDVEAEGDSVQRFSARDGQETAARLLVEGYGNMAFFVRRRPTFEECLIKLLSRRDPRLDEARKLMQDSKKK